MVRVGTAGHGLPRTYRRNTQPPVRQLL
jgi:hypothetical protein